MWRPLNPSPLTAAWDEAVDPPSDGPSPLWHLKMRELRAKYGIPEPDEDPQEDSE
ncbi:MAG TPA: hypothetical protein PLA94_19160 [Myxococcota bacterium]|nr:hypothetical protein [Myxococcota bacterium]